MSRADGARRNEEKLTSGTCELGENLEPGGEERSVQHLANESRKGETKRTCGHQSNLVGLATNSRVVEQFGNHRRTLKQLRRQEWEYPRVLLER